MSTTMSILIKGEKMPKECEYCMFAGFGGAENEYYVCMFNGKWKDRDSHGRMESCPLVEIPPHGRLIDSDKLVRHMEERQQRLNDDKALWELSVVDTFLSDAPTVIESEQENE